ncbi:hypothetical protein L484_023709 [Morus notabilis]|uniref:Uncharacterized protein n=1 Tax=Morus notabilis TaxID=981085 RepID=W9RCQ6_9ROSA|nr:hypothetical protein L484_023709 [Morus notabilis]
MEKTQRTPHHQPTESSHPLSFRFQPSFLLAATRFPPVTATMTQTIMDGEELHSEEQRTPVSLPRHHLVNHKNCWCNVSFPELIGLSLDLTGFLPRHRGHHKSSEMLDARYPSWALDVQRAP